MKRGINEWAGLDELYELANLYPALHRHAELGELQQSTVVLSEHE